MQTLNREDPRSLAPSIFTRSAYPGMSDRYRVAETAQVVDLLEGEGYFPVRAQQSRCRLPDKKVYAKHLIRFRRPQDNNAEVATEIPEVVLTNSFDGSSSYVLHVGLHRICCLNGLVCPTSDLSHISVRHSGKDDFPSRILDATFRVMEQAPAVLAKVQEWKQITLSRPQQVAFAEASMELKPAASIEPTQLLTSRRPEDDANPDGSRDLWRTLNACQEAILKGGIKGKAASGRRTTTKPIKAIDNDVRTNRALWMLATRMAELAN